MQKTFFALVIALLMAVVSNAQIDTRIIKKCGYSSQANASDSYVMNRQWEIRPDEHEVSNSFDTYWNATNQSWCYSYTVYCTAPLNKEIVPELSKVIEAQNCNINKL